MKINLRKLLLDGLLEESFPITPEPKLPQEPVEVPTESDGTKDLYESRKVYKQKVNSDNLPVGTKNFKNQNLKNQLDLWYGRKNYGKYDYEGRIIKSIPVSETGTTNVSIPALKKIEGTEFSLLEFAADAVNSFLFQYNQERPTHPRSKLNNITVKKAFTQVRSYKSYSDELYVEFFNDVLDPIKYSNKVSSFEDFVNLFYIWFSEKDVFATKTGFYESSQYNIYNTGLAFDYFTINDGTDIETILNDVRFPVLNYVAKINGLRIDPNFPARLIADVESEKLLNPYVSKYFPINTKTSDLPKLVYAKYFQPANFDDSSEGKIIEFMSFLAKMYNRFVGKYSTVTSFSGNSKNQDLFKSKFNTNKINRNKVIVGDFTVEQPDGSTSIKKDNVRHYVTFRAVERKVKLSKDELESLTDTVYKTIVLYNQKSFQQKTQAEKFYVLNQAINYLEVYLSSKSPANGSADKRDFNFFIKRAVKEYTAIEITLSEVFARLDAIRIGCKGAHQTASGLFLPCSTSEEYYTLTSQD